MLIYLITSSRETLSTAPTITCVSTTVSVTASTTGFLILSLKA
jgi:hypothetical protein